MAQHGGPREGAGRTPGRKNNATLAREALLAEACKRMANQAANMSPLDVILFMMREALAAGEVKTMMTAAEIALPYTAPRLAPVAVADPNAPTAQEIADDADPDFMDEGTARH